MKAYVNGGVLEFMDEFGSIHSSRYADIDDATVVVERRGVLEDERVLSCCCQISRKGGRDS